MRWNICARAKPAIASCSSMTSVNRGPRLRLAGQKSLWPRLVHKSTTYLINPHDAFFSLSSFGGEGWGEEASIRNPIFGWLVIWKTTCLAVLVNTLQGLGQEVVRYRTVQVSGLSIFYREAGPADGPVLLLLHGVPTSSRMYQPMLESTLAAKYHIIAPDYPGFGQSSWPGPKEFRRHMSDHLNINQHLNIQNGG